MGESEWEELEKLLRQQWDFDKIPEKTQPISEADQTAIKAIAKGQLVNGQYRVPAFGDRRTGLGVPAHQWV